MRTHLLLGLAFLFALIAMVLSEAPTPVQGATVVTEDWEVNQTLDFTNTVFELYANITVVKEGTLNLSLCTFRFMSSTPGEFGITVQRDGNIIASRCDFVSGRLGGGQEAEAWTFHVQAYSRLTLRQSEVRNCGVVGGREIEQGLAIETHFAGIFDNTFVDCNAGIVVLSGARPTIDGNTFEDNQYGIRVKSPTFSLNALNDFKFNRYGITFIQCGDGHLTGGRFIDNDVGIWTVDSTVVVMSVAVEGLYDGLWAAYDSTLMVVNSTVGTVGDRVHASQRSNVVMSNCAIDVAGGFTKVVDGGNITLSQSCQFRVIFSGVESPVENARVELYENNKMKRVFYHLTDSDGLTPNVPVLVFQHDRYGRVVYAPFKIVASETFNHKEIEGFDPGPITFKVIYFDDEVPPTLNVISPPNIGAFYNTTAVLFKGRVSDQHSGLLRLYYTIDGGEHHSLPITDPFEVIVTLPEGELTIDVVAEDYVGNPTVVTRVVTIDVTPPSITNISIPDGFLTRVYDLLVSGQTEPGARVFYGEMEWTVEDNGSFEGYVSIGAEEGRQTISLRLVDPAGNEDFHWFNVTVDRTPPALVVESEPHYLDFGFINQSDVVFYGTTENGSTVVISSDLGVLNQTLVDDPDGNWHMDIHLEVGDNYLLVESYDAAGNPTRNELISFHLDMELPEILIKLPENGTVIKGTTVLVKTRTEPEIDIWINDGEPEMMPNVGWLEREIVLPYEGENNVTVYARDRAGNVNSLTVTVIRDSGGKKDGDDGPSAGAAFAALALLLSASLLVLLRRGRRGARTAGSR